MSFPWRVPAVVTRLAKGELHAEWICRRDDGTFYYSTTDPHYTFEDLDELTAVHAELGGMVLAKEPEAPKPSLKPKADRQLSSPPASATPPREHWLLRWERGHES